MTQRSGVAGFAGHNAGMSGGFSFTEAWLRMLSEVRVHGAVSAPRGLETLELNFTAHRVQDPLSFPLRANGREFRDVIGVLEALSLIGEFSVPELFTDRVGKFARFMDGGILWGSYGARTHGQLGDVVQLLQRDPDSRQAVMTFYDAKRDLNREKLDIPCTIAAHFILRNRRFGPEDVDVRPMLDLGITMRSNDLWLGTPYDFTQFGILQATVAQALGADVGRYYHRVGSLHLYAHDIDKTDALEWEGGPSMKFPLWPTGQIDHIQSRARMLAIGQLPSPQTEFEYWARDLLRR